MRSIEPILRRALTLVRPTPDEERILQRTAEFIVEKTRRAALAFAEVKEVTLGGSFAKGTWLPSHADLDIFLKLDVNTPDDKFEEIGLKVGAEATKGHPRGKKYAQHPYTEANVDGVKVNIVPCYDVKPKEWKSAADRSPFHVELVKKMSQDQKDQVRLLKQFMRGVGTYGAEIEIQGFSGYAAEVLIIQHHDLLGALKSFAEIKRQADGKLLRLPDPVDPERDLARAMSDEKLARMVLASREFLSNPSIACFGRMRGRIRPAMKENVVAVVFAHSKLSEDTLWGELRRTIRHVRRHLEEKGFKIARALPASNNSNSSAFIFVPEFHALPRLEQRLGPTVDRKKETETFVKVNRRRAKLIWVDDDARVRILQEREWTDFSSFLAWIAKAGARKTGASDEVGRGMARTGRVLSGRSLRRMATSARWLRDGMDEIASDTAGTGAS
ncbi:MAG: CCA tRNA nucleotidyltransferase [Nitrososphaerales archaeon]|nr:CCA tRNA nucleotidyltransferase [Nitrososphaerales archaeon]